MDPNRPKRGDGVNPRDPEVVRKEVEDRLKRDAGELPHYSKLQDGSQLLSHIPVVGEEEGTFKSLGKIANEAHDTQQVRFDSRPGATDHLWFFHIDFLAAVMQTQVNVVDEYRSRLLAGTKLPLYRVHFPTPIFESEYGPECNNTLLATPKGVLAEVLATYILEAGFTRRYTKKEQEAYKEQTGKELFNQYWEVKSHSKFPGPLGVTFDLFLPTGIDFEFVPYVSPVSGKPTKLLQKAPDQRVIAAAYKAMTQGHAVDTQEEKYVQP